MSKASVDLLDSLHNAVAVELIQRIENGEASSSDLSAAIKLLKDNSITAVIEDNGALSEMEKKLAAMRAKRGGKPVVVPSPTSPVSADEQDAAIESAMSRERYGA